MKIIMEIELYSFRSKSYSYHVHVVWNTENVLASISGLLSSGLLQRLSHAPSVSYHICDVTMETQFKAMLPRQGPRHLTSHL